MVQVAHERWLTMDGGVKVSCMIPMYVRVFYTLSLVCGGRPQNPYSMIAVNGGYEDKEKIHAMGFVHKDIAMSNNRPPSLDKKGK